MVQIRDSGGSLITISHSAATVVKNHSRNWSRVDYKVPIDPAVDPNKAIEILRTTIEQLAAEPAWQQSIVEPIELIGIDSFSRDAIVLHARIRTEPLRQYAVERELNDRVAKAFSEAKIPFGAPTTT
jgi:small conductance mechanosensitive channel